MPRSLLAAVAVASAASLSWRHSAFSPAACCEPFGILRLGKRLARARKLQGPIMSRYRAAQSAFQRNATRDRRRALRQTVATPPQR